MLHFASVGLLVAPMENKLLSLPQHPSTIILHSAQPLKKFSFCMLMLIMTSGTRRDSIFLTASLLYPFDVHKDEICYWAVWFCSGAKESRDVWQQLNLQFQQAHFETENTSQSFRKAGKKAVFFQNSFTVPGKGTAERGCT